MKLSPHDRDRLVEEIVAECQRFLGDVGAVLAGAPDGLDEHVDHACAEVLRRDLGATTGVTLVPDFGEWGSLVIEGPLSTTEPLTAHVDFSDATTATDPDGRPVPVSPRDLRVTLVIDPVTMRVEDAHFSAR